MITNISKFPDVAKSRTEADNQVDNVANKSATISKIPVSTDDVVRKATELEDLIPKLQAIVSRYKL